MSFYDFLNMQGRTEPYGSFFETIMMGRYKILEKEFQGIVKKISEAKHFTVVQQETFTFMRKGAKVIVLLPYRRSTRQIEHLSDLCLDVTKDSEFEDDFEYLYSEVEKFRTDAKLIYQYLVNILSGSRPKDRLPTFLQEMIPNHLTKTSDAKVRKSVTELKVEELIKEYLTYRIFQ